MAAWLGQVIYNEDPTFSGRCKVRVFGLFDDLPEDNIPWFTPVSSNIFSSGGAGSISVPKVGDIVRVDFSNSDYYSGEYRAIQNIDPELINEIKEDYQGTHVLLYDADKNLLVIYQPGTGYKMFLDKASIIINSNGDITLTHRNQANVIQITNDAIRIVSGNNSPINISTNAEVNIDATTFNVNADKINLGKNCVGDRHLAVAESVQTALNEIATELLKKYPPSFSSTAIKDFSNVIENSICIK